MLTGSTFPVSSRRSEDSRGLTPTVLSLDQTDPLETLDIDAMLERLASNEVQAPIQSDVSVSYPFTAALPSFGSGQTTQIIPPCIAAATIMAPTRYLPEQRSVSMPHRSTEIVPQYRSSFIPSDPLMGGLCAHDNGPQLPPSPTISPQIQMPAQTPFMMEPFNYAPSKTAPEAQFPEGGSMPWLGALPPMPQCLVSPQDLHNASFRLFNAPPSELPSVVCSALLSSLQSQVR